MARRNLRSSSLLGAGDGMGEDPMSSMGNLMDVMLVFACGLMVALIAHYNVDFSPEQETLGDGEELDADLSEVSWGDNASQTASSYQELGTVYQDSETGELYLVYPDDIDAADE